MATLCQHKIKNDSLKYFKDYIVIFKENINVVILF